MRYILIGLTVILLVSILLGYLTTPKYTPFRKVVARGAYFAVVGMVLLAIGAGVGVFIYEKSLLRENEDFGRLSPERREEIRDSLRKELPQPSVEELKTKFVTSDFDAVLIPCYETVHKLDVATLKEIVSLEIVETRVSEGIFEIQTTGELRVNKPVPGFHVKGTFVVQYEFFKGDSDIDPGWKFDKILISQCEVLSIEDYGEEKLTRDSLYPDLPRSN